MVKATHTTHFMERGEMIELLSALNVTTTLVRLAETREDRWGVCGSFTVAMTPDRMFSLIIELDH